MSAMASQITGVLIVCSPVCSGAEKKQSSGGFPSQRRKFFPIDDVINRHDDEVNCMICVEQGVFQATCDKIKLIVA